MFRSRAVGALVAMLALAGACSGGGGAPRLLVVVDDGDGAGPVEGVRLVVESAEEMEVARGFTDADGRFTVDLPGPGTFVVSNLHLADDPPCWWDVPRSEVVGSDSGTVRLELVGYRVCT